jgi:hypothetical protein
MKWKNATEGYLESSCEQHSRTARYTEHKRRIHLQLDEEMKLNMYTTRARFYKHPHATSVPSGMKQLLKQ